jgi:uncharacterized protein (TIGR02598 family)
MKRFLHTTHAFSLIEVTLALGVAGFCLIAVFGLLPIGVQTNQRALSQTAATAILSSVIADMRATPRTSPPGSPTPSPQYQIPIPANPVTSPTTAPPLFFAQEGTFSTSIQSQSRYRLTVTFLTNDPGTTPAKTATLADLKVTWPAPATTANAIGSVEMLAAFDRN